MDYSLPGSSVHGISQARILERVAIPFSRGSSQPRDQTRVSCIAGGLTTSEPPEKNSVFWIQVPYKIGDLQIFSPSLSFVFSLS